MVERGIVIGVLSGYHAKKCMQSRKSRKQAPKSAGVDPFDMCLGAV